MDMNIISSRQEAVRNFQNDFMMMDHPLGNNENHRQSSLDNHSGDTFDEAVQLLDGRQPNPALVYRKNKKQKEQELREKALALARKREQEDLERKQTKGKANENDSSNVDVQTAPLTKGLVKVKPSKAELDEVDENELYDPKFIREAWSAYGSTEVELLQLTDQRDGSTEIVAVAPYNHALVSYRKLEYEEKRAFSVQIGFHQKFMFTVEDHHGALDDEEEEAVGTKRQQQLRDNDSPVNKTLYPNSQHQSERASEQQGTKDDSTSNAETNPRDNRMWDSFISTYQFGVKTAAFSAKILQAMETNAGWLYNNLKDDFVSRTIQSGKRTVEYMPKAANMMSKVVKQMLGWDDGDNDPSGFGGSGPRGGASPA